MLLSSGTAAKLGVGVGDVLMLTVGLHWTLRHALKPTPQQVRELLPPAPVTRSWRFGKAEALFTPPPCLLGEDLEMICGFVEILQNFFPFLNFSVKGSWFQ